MDAVRGRLITASFARHELPSVGGATEPPPTFTREIDRWWQRVDATLGPASSVRAVTDGAALPLVRLLGFDVHAREDTRGAAHLRTISNGRVGPAVVITRWNESLDDVWRPAVLGAIAADARWALLFNGPTLRLVDARRTWTREFLEFNLPAVTGDPAARLLCWCTVTAHAIAGSPPLLDRLVDLSSRHGQDVCRALGTGVLEALTALLGALRRSRRDATAMPVLFEHSLTVLYRVLFLLFAEARGLVPMWHPVYRDRYSIEAIVTTLLAGRRCRGLWHAVQAISRLAHAGCVAGELKVTAFNGRLFSPSDAAAFNRARIDDDTMAAAIMAVGTTGATARRTRARIAYADLDVEQLGSVYEQVLEYEPGGGEGPAMLTRTREGRKASGTFYTPRSVTSHLVRRTLEPLVRGRSADAILSLRILDPAMGSGAFLVAACRYLAAAIEEALLRDGTWQAGDVTAADRLSLRREIASRCLYGADVNPMAVQLARLSLWLATLAADKPLSFLDHHLVAGDSLVGASIADVERQPSKQATRARRAPLPLFEAHDAGRDLADAARIRTAMARTADDSVDVVRSKEQALAALTRRDTAIGRWSAVLDLWCAGWFWERDDRPDRATFGDLTARLLHARSSLPPAIATPLLDRAAAVAARHRFLHWPLVFPEVFTGDGGPGFDAVIGNPPWDMMRGDSGSGDVRRERQRDAQLLAAFVRESGVYEVESRAHANRYQLFVERALQLLRDGGRLGFVLPSGIVSDTGTANLRRHLFDRAGVDAITGLDNRAAIFPIHRSLRFVLITCTAGIRTDEMSCRFGVTGLDDLESNTPVAAPVVVTRRLLDRLSGPDDLGVPEIAGATDLRLLEQITAHVPWLAREEGWHVSFGRELNATDDRAAFAPVSGAAWSRPVVEGKQVEPFHVAVDRSTLECRPGAPRARRVPRRARLAYRDVASATNRLTLIAAIVPARAVTTHTLFCLRTPLPLDHQHVLCALLNSFVANYLVRFRVNTHVTVALVSRLPVPVVRPGDAAFRRLAALARSLADSNLPAHELPEYAELQALAARLYGLSRDDFAHVLSTFPLIEEGIRHACLGWFERLQ